MQTGENTKAADWIIASDDPILLTGGSGFIGMRVVQSLLRRGFRNLRCIVRSSGASRKLEAIRTCCGDGARVEMIKGNLASRQDCIAATRDVAVIYHVAAGTGQSMFADAFMNSVVTTRNLLEAALLHRSIRRFVNISSFSVYSNRQKSLGRVLDESCPIETEPEKRGDAYTFAKVKQDEMVIEYGQKFGIPYVIVRPGVVYGPGKVNISNRVGIGTFGIFLHLGGSNEIPLTYVDNCAEAIALAGLQRGVDGEVFNVVDDDLPSSRRFLQLYKENVKDFSSIYLPHGFSYFLCWFWEKYSEWSEGQLPPAFNRRGWHAFWKNTRYTNEKLKSRLHWTQPVSSTEALNRYFESCRESAPHA
jgi:nucleoside-diphosphate-sugar epimerase